MPTSEDQEWKQHMFETYVADQRIQALTMQIAESISRHGAPTITLADTAAARRYLRKCLLNMSVSEISQLRIADVAALWARGAAGAAQWRLRGHHGGQSRPGQPPGAGKKRLLKKRSGSSPY